MMDKDTSGRIFGWIPETTSEPPTPSSRATAIGGGYDEEARAVGWLGPQVAFGLLYEHISPGQSILDMGIGTGLAALLFRKAGLTVFGMDVSHDMLDAARTKGFEELALQDLRTPPYPYAPWSFDHVACIGVLPFISDLSPVFMESARLLKKGGNLVFTTLERADGEAGQYSVRVDKNLAGGDEAGPVSMYRHTTQQVEAWVDEAGLTMAEALLFTAYRDRKRAQSMQAKCFLARRR